MHFSYKGGYRVCERTSINAFKTRTGLGYKFYTEKFGLQDCSGFLQFKSHIIP